MLPPSASHTGLTAPPRGRSGLIPRRPGNGNGSPGPRITSGHLGSHPGFFWVVLGYIWGSFGVHFPPKLGQKKTWTEVVYGLL